MKILSRFVFGLLLLVVLSRFDIVLDAFALGESSVFTFTVEQVSDDTVEITLVNGSAHDLSNVKVYLCEGNYDTVTSVTAFVGDVEKNFNLDFDNKIELQFGEEVVGPGDTLLITIIATQPIEIAEVTAKSGQDTGTYIGTCPPTAIGLTNFEASAFSLFILSVIFFALGILIGVTLVVLFLRFSPKTKKR